MPDTTIHLDHWEILLTTSLLIPEGQEARLLLTPDDPLIVRIRFENVPPRDGEPLKTTVSVSGEGNDGVITFTNWNNPFDGVTETPLEFAGDDKGRQIAVMGSARKLGKCHQVFLQFMRKG